MTAIDIGTAAEDRASGQIGPNTVINYGNAANATGILTSFEVWFDAGNNDGTDVKIGTFSGGGTDYDDRDYETIGAVTKGSKQTFSGLSCNVVTGDFIGIYLNAGRIEMGASGGSDFGYIAEDTFGQGLHTYTNVGSYITSLYGSGDTWGANIAKINGIEAGYLGKVDGISVASITKVNGVAV